MTSYSLDLAQRKGNVFVTQLRDHEGEDENKYPIVKESTGELVLTGVKTLQSTRLVKENNDAREIQRELEQKRVAFKKAMIACKIREGKLGKRQQETKQKIERFHMFIKETEAKRRRALVKYQTEYKITQQKLQELVVYKKDFELLKQRRTYLQEKVEKYSVYEDYLIQVLEIIPNEYIDKSSDSKIAGIMMRFETLKTTNEHLNDSLAAITEKMKFNQHIIHDFKQKYDHQLVINNSQLALLQDELEHCIQRNAQREHTLNNAKERYRKQSALLGNTKLAVVNIAEMCLRKHSKPIEIMTMDDMLTLIQEYLEEHKDIAKLQILHDG